MCAYMCVCVRVFVLVWLLLAEHARRGARLGAVRGFYPRVPLPQRRVQRVGVHPGPRVQHKGVM